MLYLANDIMKNKFTTRFLDDKWTLYCSLNIQCSIKDSVRDLISGHSPHHAEFLYAENQLDLNTVSRLMFMNQGTLSEIFTAEYNTNRQTCR